MFNVFSVVLLKECWFCCVLEEARQSAWDNIVTCHHGDKQARTWSFQRKCIGAHHLKSHAADKAGPVMVSTAKPWSQGWLIAAGAFPSFCSMKQLEVFLLPVDRMLIHHSSLPRNFLGFPQQFTGTHLYTRVERGTVRVKCLAQEHNTMSPASEYTSCFYRSLYLVTCS